VGDAGPVTSVPAGVVAVTWVSSAPGTLVTLVALVPLVPAGAPTGVKMTSLAWVSLAPVMVTCWPPAGSPLGGETPDTSGGTKTRSNVGVVTVTSRFADAFV